MVSPLKILSVFVYALLVTGYLNRKRKRVHIPLMLSAITIDVAIVLYLEISRHVVEGIPKRELTPLLVFHIALSTVVLVLYGIQLVTGVRKARGQVSTLHPKVGLLTLILRFGNLVTSWLVV